MAETPRVVLLMHPFAGYDRGLLQGIARYAHLHGPWVFCMPDDHPSIPMPESDSFSGEALQTLPLARNSRTTSRPLHRLGATGVIGRVQTPAVAKALLGLNVPLIAIDLTDEQRSPGSPLADVSEICADSHNAGRLAADHLIERGFTSFGFCGYPGRHWSETRRRGFGERLRESNFSCHDYQVKRKSRTMPWGHEQPLLVDWLRALPKPVGVMACNDIRGRQVVESCLLAGFRVPDDVAVVGVDEDRLLCDLANPPLSSVALNLERAGYQAAELLDALMSGKARRPQRIVAEAMWVIPRRSTDVVAIEDRHVAAAARFIRDHFRESITVGHVVAESGVSRRSLEVRFQRSLGLSIRQQIQKVRLAWSKKLLVETNLSAEKIADLSGFSSLSYMSSVFQRELAQTITEYRRQARTP